MATRSERTLPLTNRMAEIRSIIRVAIISSVSHKLLTIKVIR